MNASEVLVIGHRNPDADAICSAIGYAEFKRRTGLPNAVAARCGDINDRVEFILKSFGVPPPRFVADVSPRVRDVMKTEVIHATPQTTVAEALALMDERRIRVLPVLGPDRSFAGFASVFKMTRHLCPRGATGEDFRRIHSSAATLARTLNAELKVAADADREEELALIVAAMSPEALTRRIAECPDAKAVVIAGDSEALHLTAVRGRARALVLTRATRPGAAVIEEARRLQVNLLLSPHNSTTTSLLCGAASPLGHVIHEHFLAFREDELLADAQAQAVNSAYQAFPVLDSQKRVVGILSKSDFLKKVRRQLILVDHNELSQAVPGAELVEILEIIDHHRLGVQSSSPILFHNEPVGSTSSIVADCFFRGQIELPKPIAGLLLAGLVSDTLNLTSPTTTAKDRALLERLERISATRAADFMQKLFGACSVLASKAPQDALLIDCKEFREGDRVFSAAQIEEIGFDEFWKRKPELMTALEAHRGQKGYHFSALLVTDVTHQTSLLLITGAAAVIKQIDYPCVEPGIFEMPGVVSRKKQLLPYLTACLEKQGTRRAPEPEPVTMV